MSNELSAVLKGRRQYMFLKINIYFEYIGKKFIVIFIANLIPLWLKVGFIKLSLLWV